jgi:hypothetical protein
MGMEIYTKVSMRSVLCVVSNKISILDNPVLVKSGEEGAQSVNHIKLSILQNSSKNFHMRGVTNNYNNRIISRTAGQRRFV